jgi:AraC family transcriptional regulator
MQFRIESIPAKKLIGKRLTMTLANNKTFELWKSFMPRRKEIKNTLSPTLFNIQALPPSIDFKDRTSETEFERWAAQEVSDFNEVPDGMETYTLHGGLYAVFLYKGSSSDFQKPFQFIFSSWLPNSKYELDKRDHFELLGDKYKNNDPDSEEEIWIPIKLKNEQFCADYRFNHLQ